RGTVFIDGNVTIDGDTFPDDIIYYKGNGTLVVNGDLTLLNRFLPDGKILDKDNVLGVVTDHDLIVDFGGSNSQPSRADADFSGAFFVGGTAKFNHNNLSFVGSIVAGLLDFTSSSNCHLFTHPQLPTFLPPNLPGADERMVSISNWHEVRPPSVVTGTY
ncbi:MAG: hypothetical protein KAS39_00720, partial [Actinomycetia bacterium]|nr:hypothetical protein [Actinomycetes bacterium]